SKSPITSDHRRPRCSVRAAGLRLLCLRSCIVQCRLGIAATRLAGFDLSAKDCAVFNGETLRANLAGDTACVPQLHALGALNFSVDVAAIDDLARGDIGFDLAVRTYGARGVSEVQLALESAINKQILF